MALPIALKRVKVDQRGGDLDAEGYKGILTDNFSEIRAVFSNMTSDERAAQSDQVKTAVGHDQDFIDLMYADDCDEDEFKEMLGNVNAENTLSLMSGFKECGILEFE